MVASPIRLEVSGVKGVCTVMKSLFAQMSSRSAGWIPTSLSCSLDMKRRVCDVMFKEWMYDERICRLVVWLGFIRWIVSDKRHSEEDVWI